MKRILVLSRGATGKYMSSLGIRAHAMAQVLARAMPEADITLAIPNTNDQPEDLPPSIRVTNYGPMWGLKLISEHDIIISSGFSPHFATMFPKKLFVADLISQYYIEWMEMTKTEAKGTKRDVWMNKNRAYLAMQLTFADFVICNNERQRDTYIGMLNVLGLTTPSVYDQDDTLRRQIDICSHGIRNEELKQNKPAMKGVYSGVRETDKLIIWNGGTVAWYDPEPFLRALHVLSKERDDIKAIFLGTFYPGLGSFLGYGERFKSAFQLSKDLGLYQKSVFFEFGWLPHQDVKDFLVESDLGVCTYFHNLETRYSHRTRFLDLIWAELPIICTSGDVLAERVEQEGLGIVVEPHDTEAVANAIRKLVDDEDFLEQCKANLRAIKPELSWDVTFEPLIRFCREGKSYSAAKQDRFLPLLARSAEFLFTRFVDSLTPNR